MSSSREFRPAAGGKCCSCIATAVVVVSVGSWSMYPFWLVCCFGTSVASATAGLSFSVGVRGWFTLKHPNLFPGECPCRFFDSDRELLHTSSMCPCENLTRCLFFCLIFRQLRFFGKCGPPQPNIFLQKQEKKKKLRVRPRDVHLEHVCKN